MINSMPAITRTTQETAPGGRGAALRPLRLAGLNFAINAMVSPGFRAPCKNRSR